MDFSEYANGLYPFCSGGVKEPRFVTAIVGNFIKDAAMDACYILKRKDDTRYRYYRGTRHIQPQHAQYIYEHRDIDKFVNWINDQMDESDSFEAVTNWLTNHGITVDNYETAEACASLLESIILSLISDTESPKEEKDISEDISLIDEIKAKILLLPRPKEVPVPPQTTEEEHDYIQELLAAYGDAEDIDDFAEDNLVFFPDYQDDLSDRRIDFYAAESVRRSVLELGNGRLADQFDVLKNETLSQVKDTERKTYPNGYERMLTVMEKASGLNLHDYLLSESPYWINGKILKGTCHHLVIDGKLKWVRKKKN